MCDPGSSCPKQRDFGSIKLYTMRMPDISSDPAQTFRIFTGAAPESLERIGDVFIVFGQMGMHHDAFVTRQHCSISHEAAADRERRTRRHAHATHCTGAAVVKRIDDTDAIFQNCGLRFDQTVRWQSAIRHANAHRASCGMKPQTNLCRRVDCVFQTGTIGEKVKVVTAKAAA